MVEEKKLQGKKILLGVTGGIAAYKSADLCRKLIEAGALVRVVMTPGAEAFVTKLTFQALTHQPVYTQCFDEDLESGMGHIELARWADILLVAPATAHFIAQIATGLAPDLLTTLYLASANTVNIVIAPAMNVQMWNHPATQENIQKLRARGVLIVGPGEGSQACGEIGLGRLLEPKEIINELIDKLIENKNNYKNTNINKIKTDKILDNQTLLITAGPTREPIDPVRYLTNKSSGKMGFALADAAQKMGAKVILIAGPVTLETPLGVERIDVETADEMHQAVTRVLDSLPITVFISVAAVSDYKALNIASDKIKKQNLSELVLVQNPDIIASVASRKDKPFCVAFSAETQDIIENASLKLKNKKVDMIAVNQVGSKGEKEGVGFESDDNELIVLWNKAEQNKVEQNKVQSNKLTQVILSKQPKIIIASQVLKLIADNLKYK